MALFTKSAQLPREAHDGIRVCIMRKPKPTIAWDIWMPTLAPSLELLETYHAHEISWQIYEERFHQEVIVGMRHYLELLVDMSRNHTITILCWEDTPVQCHRRLVAESCQKIAPDLAITIQ